MFQRIFEDFAVGIIVLLAIPVIFGLWSKISSSDLGVKKNKNPTIGFVLALLFGPIGFLYFSWKKAIKTTLLLILAALLLAVVFPTPLPNWAKLIVLPILAIYAYKEIMRNNLELSKSVNKVEIDQVTQDANKIEGLLKENGIVVSVVMVNNKEDYKEYCLEVSIETKMEDVIKLNKLMARALSVSEKSIEVNLNSPSENLIGIKVKKKLKK